MPGAAPASGLSWAFIGGLFADRIFQPVPVPVPVSCSCWCDCEGTGRAGAAFYAFLGAFGLGFLELVVYLVRSRVRRWLATSTRSSSTAAGAVARDVVAAARAAELRLRRAP